MAQDDNLRDDNYTDFEDERKDSTNRSTDDRVDETLQNQGVDPQNDIDRRTRDELTDDMDDSDNM